MGRLIDSLTRLKETVWGDGKKDGEEVTETSATLSRKDKRKLAKAEKLKAERSQAEQDDSDVEGEESEDESFDLTKLQESDSEEEFDLDVEDDEDEEEDEDEDEDEEEEEEDVPLSDVELDEDADVVPHQKETVNNRPALKSALSSIALPKSLKFVEHMSITSDAPHVLNDIYDDMERELAFYKQALAAANTAKKICKKEDIPFSRPTDYFAEMVKSDEHMDKLKQKLIDDETSKKASQEARRQRELKKFGKKVQHVKLQERQKDKRETMDKIKSLKRKRANNEMSTEEFDIALEEAADARPTKGAKRQAKDAKYGHGGKKRFKNKNDAESSADMSGFNSKKMKSGSKPVKRPGRNRRHNRR